MSTVTRVPQTTEMGEDQLTADDAGTTLRRYGRLQLARESFRRFRYGDGFSSSRALGFQLVLGLIPLAIAVVALSMTVEVQSVAKVLNRTLLSLSPGGSGDVVDQVLRRSASSARHAGTVALVAGALTALVALTTSMGQIERGANRIYGIQRDRPAARKYTRAFVLALVAGIPSLVGFLLLVAGGAATRAMADVYGWSQGVETVLSWLRFPVGALLDLLAITVLFRWAPRRRQPAMSWMAVGAGLSLVLWLLFTGGLALYVSTSASFGQVYGPLTGMMALVIWAGLTAASLFLGLAFAAQLEAVRAGVREGAGPDPELDLADATAPPARSAGPGAPRPEPIGVGDPSHDPRMG